MNDPGKTSIPPPLPLLTRLRFVQHQTTLLIVLIAITIAAFFLTRSLAAANRALHRSDAARWHAIGKQRLAERDATGAVAALRRAATRHRDSRDIQLSLAEAFSAAGDSGNARDVLLKIRQRFPDDPEVNLRLATLEAGSGHTDEAIRNYQTALLGLWGSEQLAQRRQLRSEYIEFLLDRALPQRALSESLLLAGEIPDDLPSHLRVGDLLLRAGDPARALQQFESALDVAPSDPEALARAGEAAFEAGSFRLAHKYLSAAPDRPRSRTLRPVVELIAALDPLMPGLATRERHRRVATATDRLAVEVERCRVTACATAGSRCTSIEGLAKETATTRAKLARRGRRGESVDAGLSIVVALAERASAACGANPPIIRAVALIAARHGVGR
ncbi:MAG TPA: tetratricopeptide repeat protein [Vicinamibacterales bacterium]|nr:tetratricopeptide repeat protein [Vicinamibacterales bacterium]